MDPNKQNPGGPSDFNEAFFDALVRHQIGLLRLSGSIRNKIMVLLDETESDIKAQIISRLDGVDQTLNPNSVRKLETLLRTIKATRAKAWDEVDKVWVQEALDLATEEPAMAERLLVSSVPAVLSTALPDVQQLKAIVNSHPFEGRTLKQWAKQLRNQDLNRIESAIKVGMVQGETSRQIAQRVVGTARLKGRDGVTQITRNQAAAITRTAVNHIGNQARNEFYQVNSDLFDKELYVATLDSRTTPVCRSNDGKTFPVGEGPIPPLHFNCRSLRVPMLDDEAIGSRPARGFTQQQLLREFAERHKLSTVPTSRAKLPHGTKGAFDAFSRVRMRQLTGQVPSKVTYQQWLTRQSAQFQDDILGPTRGKLFRKGGLSLDKFVNRKGDELTLSQLAQRDRDAFVAAGLDPDDFT